MAQLIVRNLPDDLVSALKARMHDITAAPSKNIVRSYRPPCEVRDVARWRRSSLPCRTWGGTRTLRAINWTAAPEATMYLVDTDVISEERKGAKANPGVRRFFAEAKRERTRLYISLVTIGELRQGVERIRHRGDIAQARQLERWLERVMTDYSSLILPFEVDAADIWGRLRVPRAENPLDKQIASIALLYDLIVVTHNVDHFEPTGVRVLNPFGDAS